MSWFDKFFNKKVDIYADDQYEEYMEEEYPPQTSNSSFTPAKPAYATTAHQPTKMQVVIIEPKNFDAAEKIAQSLRQMRPVVINFEETDAHVASRIVDFISGATYALDGKVEKIGKDIFIVAPSNVSVDFTDKTYTELSDNFASWKESQV